LSDSNRLFNFDKDDYSSPSLFLGKQGVGLFDTVNKQFPEIWKRYKSIKSLDWDENEFEYESCANDFKTCSKSTYDMMIKTLAFQWEADSVASRISPIVGCFVTSSELWAAWQRLSDQESVHAATYSEIVRNAFDDPNEVLDEVLKVREAMNRLSTVAEVLQGAAQAAHEYAAGLRDNNQELYNHAFMFTIGMLALERIQFMSSFAVTFALCDTGLFTPIGKAIQKISQDELEEHVELDKAIIRNELKTERGRIAYKQCEPLITKLIEEVVDSELEWVDYLFSEGRELVGLNSKVLKQWSLYCAKDVYDFLDINTERKFPQHNPLKFMEKWLDISKTQPSNQEELNNQYKVGIIKRDDSDMVFDEDF
jgi:ribonucleoside-diphosphate reductase beta chain